MFSKSSTMNSAPRGRAPPPQTVEPAFGAVGAWGCATRGAARAQPTEAVSLLHDCASIALFRLARAALDPRQFREMAPLTGISAARPPPGRLEADRRELTCLDCIIGDLFAAKTIWLTSVELAGTQFFCLGRYKHIQIKSIICLPSPLVRVWCETANTALVRSDCDENLTSPFV
jgi:hypothetical protein